MKTKSWLLGLALSLWGGAGAYAQATDEPKSMPVEERMAKARAAKAQKKIDRAAYPTPPRPVLRPTPGGVSTTKPLKGPNGEAIHTGERGAKYYINKNGSRTYLSSNQ